MTRIARAWAALEPQQRLAAVAALSLWVTLLLPWYRENVTESNRGGLQAVGHNVTGFGAFSFVEAAVLLVSAGVLALMFARGERNDFHMPGSDGAIVTIAGAWTALLVFYRMLDTPSLSARSGRVITDVGPQFGIFLALIAAAGLAYAGWRMRAVSEPEPPLVRRRARPRYEARAASPQAAEDVTVVAPAPARAERADPVPARAGRPRPLTTPATTAARKRPRYPPAPAQQLSFEDQPHEPEPR